MTGDELDALHAETESTIEHTNINIRYAIERMEFIYKNLGLDFEPNYIPVTCIKYEIEKLQKQLTDAKNKS